MESKTVTQLELQDIVKDIYANGGRLINIVGVDTGTTIEIIYFFHMDIDQVEIYKIIVPKEDGNEEVKSITPIILGAYIAENEICEMFGVHMEGIPGRFFLHEDLETPLRKPMEETKTSEKETNNS